MTDNAPLTPLNDVRTRIVVAALNVIARVGLNKTSLEDVARAAHCARATVYRHFPGGRDEVIDVAIGHAIESFFLDLAEVGVDAPTFAERLALVLPHARRAVLTHPVLQRVLATEPELILPILTTESHRLLPAISAFIRPLLVAEVAAGRMIAMTAAALEQRAAFLARMLLSLLSSPAQHDLGDPDSVRYLIEYELLAGLMTH
jgi:AcrR family transcriptional regulator